MARLPRARHLRFGVLALLFACLLAACGGSSSKSTTPQLDPGKAGPPRPAHDPVTAIFEDANLVDQKPVQGLQLLKSAGADAVRVYVNWNQTVPDPTAHKKPAFNAADPGAYPSTTWASLDAIVRAAAAAHVKPLLTIGGGAPVWAAGPGAPANITQAGAWKPSAKDFGQFMHALGKRYSGTYTPAGATGPLPRVDFWAIWNEPNVGTYIRPQGTDNGKIADGPIYYRKLLNAAWANLASTGHTAKSDKILIGETAPHGNVTVPNTGGITAPLRFIRELYCVDGSYKPLSGTAAKDAGCPTSPNTKAFRAKNPGLFQAGGWADHPYESGVAPTVPVPSAAGADSADFSTINNLISTLNSVNTAYGDRHKLPVYSTEFGYNTYFLSTSKAAEYMNEAEYLTWRNPQFRSYAQYLLTDPPKGQGNFRTGLETSNGAKKPDVYNAYVMPLWLPQTKVAPKKPVTVWGCARPVLTPASNKVQIQFAPNGGKFHTLKTVAINRPSTGCYFQTKVAFPSSGRVQLSYGSGPSVLHSRVQAVEAR